MATAFIPLITALAPELIALIAGLIHQAAPAAEASNGPQTGPVKFAEVFQDVVGKLQAAAAAGQIGKELPSDDTIKLIIQAVVTSMKITGTLSPAPAPVAISTQSISLKLGQTLTISAAAA